MSGQRVGVVGDPELAEAVEAVDGDPVVVDAAGGSGEAVGSVDLFVGVGDAALAALARRRVDAPVLPVETDAGLQPVPRPDVETALARVLDDDYGTVRQPIVSPQGASIDAPALFDVALVAAEPARISEYSVQYDGERIARFRADGVVAATPAGSVGYNRAADGPVVAPGADVLSVVPLAPFTTDADRWVLPVDGVTLRVERDETPVELLADGRRVRTVEADTSIALPRGGDVRTVVVPESGPFF